MGSAASVHADLENAASKAATTSSASPITTLLKQKPELVRVLAEQYRNDPTDFDDAIALIRQAAASSNDAAQDNGTNAASGSSTGTGAGTTDEAGVTDVASKTELSATTVATNEAICRELNECRRDPAKYAEKVQKLIPLTDAKGIRRRPGRPHLQTDEGTVALEECVVALQQQVALPEFAIPLPEGLCRAAMDHCLDHGPTGSLGHSGSDGSGSADRMSRHGIWIETCGENISYGNADPEDIVVQLLVDDGVPDRGHRVNILNPKFRVVGIACGSHAKYGSMCVMDFAGGFTEGNAAADTSKPLSVRSTTITKEIQNLINSTPQAHALQAALGDLYKGGKESLFEFIPPSQIKVTVNEAGGATTTYTFKLSST